MEAERNKTNDLKKRSYQVRKKWSELSPNQKRRILADARFVYDSMYSNRPYRNRMNFDKVVSIIKEVSGSQLAPDVVDAFLRLVDKGEFRDPDDMGGGSTENIENIRSKDS